MKGIEIKKLREKKGLSQRQLAKRLGWHPYQIKRIERAPRIQISHTAGLKKVELELAEYNKLLLAMLEASD